MNGNRVSNPIDNNEMTSSQTTNYQQPVMASAKKRGMRPIWVVLISVILAGGIAGGGTYAYENQKTNKDKNNLQLQIDIENKKIDDLNSQLSTETKKAEASASTSSSSTSTNSNEIASHDVAISYNSAHTIATITNNGTKAGEIDPGYYTNIKIIKQTQNNAYLSAQPDGIGGYILYTQGFPTYKLDLATNKLGRITDKVLDISPTENYIAYIDRDSSSNKSTVVMLNLVTKAQKTFDIPSKYQQAGDVKFSPNEQKIAYSAAIGDASDNDGGNIYIIDVSKASQTQVLKSDTTGGKIPHVTGWDDNTNVSYATN